MDLKMFMAQNKKVREPLFHPATKSLTDENGEPLKWKIVGISTKEDDRLRARNTKTKRIKGAEVADLNSTQYLAEVAVASIEMPDLNDADLQDSYGVEDAVELLQEMVDLPGEYAALINVISEYNGFDTSLNEKVEQAKN